MRLSREFAYPVDFPGFSAVGRPRLFHARRLRRDVQPQIAHVNGSAFVSVLVVEFAAAVSELSDDWGKVERSLVNVNQIDRPLMSFGLVKPERLAFIAFMRLNAIDIEFFENSRCYPAASCGLKSPLDQPSLSGYSSRRVGCATLGRELSSRQSENRNREIHPAAEPPARLSLAVERPLHSVRFGPTGVANTKQTVEHPVPKTYK
jgi:hypothetical protein